MTHRPVLSPCPGGVVKACAAGVLPISSSLWVGEMVGETVGYYFGYLSLSLSNSFCFCGCGWRQIFATS